MICCRYLMNWRHSRGVLTRAAHPCTTVLMRHIETMKGKGTVTGNSGQQVPVTYELHVYQSQVPAGTLDDPRATVPGLKEIRGRIEPVSFYGQERLLLEMQDGRKLRFFFTDMRGSIALNEWIG
jgi:hypothetical protein